MSFAPVQHSADGQWWWDGAQWVPAWTPDGQWWFDGSRWRRARNFPRRRRLDRGERVVALVWVVGWVVAVAWAFWAVTPNDVENAPMPLPMFISGIGLLFGLVVGLLVTAGWLAARRRWPGVLVLVLGVTGAVLAWYVAAMLAVPVPPGQPDIQDDAAGAGLVLIAVPTFGIAAALTGIGAGVGVLVRNFGERRDHARSTSAAS